MNRRLDMAIELLQGERVSCVIVREDKAPILAKGLGIRPILECLRSDHSAFAGGAAADKVVGKAAALLFILGGVISVYGEVMSEDAVKILEKYYIVYKYGRRVPYIENSSQTGRCPMEEAVLKIDDPKTAFDILEKIY